MLTRMSRVRSPLAEAPGRCVQAIAAFTVQ
jgi:hypothetical protein